MAGFKENVAFAKAILPQYLLDDAIDWIKANLDPEDVFEDDKLAEWGATWADNKGYIKPGA